MDNAAIGDGDLDHVQKPAPTREELIELEPRIRRLARRLTADPNDAEDLAQDGWVRMLRHPPAHGRALGTWVKSIVRSAAITHFQKTARRTSANQHFDEHAGPGVTPEQALERQEVVRDIRATLEELGPTYARVLRLRFLEELSAQEIAASEGLPVETIRTRIKRGLCHMRAALDHKWGDRRRWLVALAAWSGEPVRATRDLALAASIGAATCCIVWLVVSSPVRPVARELAPVLAHAVSPPAPERSASEPLRLALPSVPDSAEVHRPALLHVRARSAGFGEAIPGLLVRAEPIGLPHAARTSLRTDPRGELALVDLEPGTWRIVPARGSPRLISLQEGDEREVVLVVDEGLGLGGTVVLPDGLPAVAVEVCATLPGSITEAEVVAWTDEQGRFELQGVDPFAWIHARHPTLRATTMRLAADAARGAEPLLLELRSPSAWQGRVVDADARPVAGASVEVLPVEPVVPNVLHDGVLTCQPPNPTTRTGEDGSFALAGLLLRHSLVIVQCDGYLESRQQLDLLSKQSKGVGVEPMRCVLKPEPGAALTGQDTWIHGVVEDARGSALPGALVAALPATSEPLEPLTALGLRSLFELEAVSREDGSFRLATDGGDYDLFVLPRDGDVGGARRAAARVPGGSQGIVLRSGEEPGSNVTGQVRGRAGEWLLVILASRDGELPRAAEPDAEGRWRLESLAPGAWDVFRLRSDALELVRESLELRAGETVDLGLLAEQGRGTIDLRISPGEGEAPTSGVQAVLRGRGRTLWLLSAKDPFDARAVYSATDLAAGTYTLECWARGMRRERLELEVLPDRTTSVSVPLVPGVHQRVALQARGREELELVVRDARWGVVESVDVGLAQGRGQAVLKADPGQYVLQVLEGEAVLLERPITLGNQRSPILLIDLDDE